VSLPAFQSLGLSEPILRALAETGYSEPTPIQAQAIPLVLEGGDLLAGAQTGTGKTAAFVLPLIERFLQQRGANPHAPRAGIRVLVVVPTRELALQVHESIEVYGKFASIKSFPLFGGVSINPQITTLKRGVDFVVATPGRLLDHWRQKTIDLSHVSVLVLDEADRMLDMGFIPDIRRILAILPHDRQNLLFSATFADPIRDLARSLLHHPKQIQVTPENTTVERVAQVVHPVDVSRKPELLIHLVREGNWFQVLVFTRTKHGANKLATQLEKNGIPSMAIHGNKSQNARTRALAEFKSGKLQVLVATDIAARGLDIEQLPHVVNFELPHVPEDYVHRIGRTGRAGADGEAISLVGSDEIGRLRDIERFIKRQIPRKTIGGFEPDKALAVTAPPSVGPRRGTGAKAGPPRVITAPKGSRRTERGDQGGGQQGRRQGSGAAGAPRRAHSRGSRP
jgi:ATP-dependent RNA helicase RhlE